MGGPNILTDLERAYTPYFDYTAMLDAGYQRCRQLFQQCHDATGFLRSPSTELKNETVKALHEFNAAYMAFASTHWYATAKLGVIQQIQQHRPRLIEHMTQDAEKQAPPQTQWMLKQLFNIISGMNEVEPVNNFWGPLRFDDVP
jgi:hypothetical protein